MCAQCFLSKHGAHAHKLFACEARLAADVGAVATQLRSLDPSPARSFARLSLGARISGRNTTLRRMNVTGHITSGYSRKVVHDSLPHANRAAVALGYPNFVQRGQDRQSVAARCAAGAPLFNRARYP